MPVTLWDYNHFKRFIVAYLEIHFQLLLKTCRFVHFLLCPYNKSIIDPTYLSLNAQSRWLLYISFSHGYCCKFIRNYGSPRWLSCQYNHCYHSPAALVPTMWHPLRLDEKFMSYSLSGDGFLSEETLFQHLYVCHQIIVLWRRAFNIFAKINV